MTLQITVEGIEGGRPIPDKFAWCVSDGQQGDNISPEIRWSGAPDGTRSFALFVVDKDSPVDRAPVNAREQHILRNAARRDFYHWLLVDIPAQATGVAEGSDGGGVIGRNDFGKAGTGANGYDGPCPPWNDELWHRYGFTVYALDVPSLLLEQGFAADEARAAMAGHVLAETEAVSLYSTNRELWMAV